MADSELQNLTEDTAPASGDIVCVVVDPAGTPLARKMTVDNLGILDGWVPDGGTWTYASASTFTVPTNLTARFGKGTKLRLVQTSAKYFYVTSSSYGAPNTTVTMTGGADYTLANAAITSPYYSYQETPQGFPNWFNYTPSITGYSVNPASATYKFRLDGRQCTVVFEEDNGTSNATTTTYSVPITSATITAMDWWGMIPYPIDNGAAIAPGICYIPSNSVTISCHKTQLGAWANSGGKCMRGLRQSYEI